MSKRTSNIKLSEIEKISNFPDEVILSKRDFDALCRVVRAANEFMTNFFTEPKKDKRLKLKEALSAFDWSDDV